MAIALFHFHAHFNLCRPRVQLLRLLNPDVRIFGLFGGESTDLEEARDLEKCGLESVHHALPESTARSRWKDTDFAVVDWFQAVGHAVAFDRVHVVQWDLLFFAPFGRVYPGVPDDAVALTGLVPLAQIAHFWDWTRGSLAADAEQLFTDARERFGYRGEPYACIGPGYSLSRSFLERYAAIDFAEAGHDELRLPLFAQILDVGLVDTGFYPRWNDPDVESVFNADPKEVEPAVIGRELERPGGRRVFHPCRDRFDSETISDLLRLTVP